MAKILLAVWSFPTHLRPFMALALALRKRGHDVAFYTGPQAQWTVEQEGFHCFPFQNLNEEYVHGVVQSLIASKRRPLRNRKLWCEFLAGTVPAQMLDLEEILEQWQPSYLVCDIAMWAPMLLLQELRRVPVIAFSHVANCILPGREGPIPGFAISREGGWVPQLIGSFLRPLMQAGAGNVRREADKLRRAYHLPELSISVTKHTGTMPLYLVPGAREFDSERSDLPPSVQYVGPCLWDKDSEAKRPAWLDRLDHAHPCILVEEGGLYTPEPRLLRIAAIALAGFEAPVVLMAGEGRPLSDVRLPLEVQNVRLCPNAPLTDVLPFTSVMVTNGNSSSMMAALIAGVPVVVVPSIWDQAELAGRVEETGVGIRLTHAKCSPERLLAAVKRVLEEPLYRERARKMGEKLLAYGGPDRAAELIENLQPAPSSTLTRNRVSG